MSLLIKEPALSQCVVAVVLKLLRYDIESRECIECTCCKELQNGAANELETNIQACKQ